MVLFQILVRFRRIDFGSIWDSVASFILLASRFDASDWASRATKQWRTIARNCLIVEGLARLSFQKRRQCRPPETKCNCILFLITSIRISEIPFPI
jgi:hypothetical protein